MTTKPPVLCKDCDTRPAREADWYVLYTKYWRKDYQWPKKYPLCTDCLMEILSDRFMGGGGPTSSDILKITSIYPKDQRGYKYP
jgi:hypothetical protein